MIRNALQRFMYGRYGNDQLNLFLLISYLVLSLLHTFTNIGLLYWVSVAALVWALVRMLSRNFARRREENGKFMKLAEPFLKWYRLKRTMHRDKEHAYFKCPSCAQQLRVPKGKGKITVTCRSCGAVFQERS